VITVPHRTAATDSAGWQMPISIGRKLQDPPRPAVPRPALRGDCRRLGTDQVRELGDVLDELVEESGRYIVADWHKLYAAALFCAMTHVHDRLHCMPKLALQSPTKRCKTRTRSTRVSSESRAKSRKDTHTANPQTPEVNAMLDLTDDAFEAQLIPPGTYAGQLVDARQVGHEQVFLALTWRIDVLGRDDPAIIEELLCAGFGSGIGDPAQTALFRNRTKAICEAHGIEPRFDGYDALVAAIIDKPMRVAVGRGTRAGLPVAKVAALLPPEAEDR
jgi:hypothetical protein